MTLWRARLFTRCIFQFLIFNISVGRLHRTNTGRTVFSIRILHTLHWHNSHVQLDVAHFVFPCRIPWNHQHSLRHESSVFTVPGRCTISLLSFQESEIVLGRNVDTTRGYLGRRYFVDVQCIFHLAYSDGDCAVVEIESTLGVVVAITMQMPFVKPTKFWTTPLIRW